MAQKATTAKSERTAIASGAFSSFSTNDIDAARSFYGDTLGLPVAATDEGGIQINFANGPDIFIYPKQDHEAATFTVLNLTVKDIDQAVDELTARGIEFEKYTGDIETDEKRIFRGADSGNGPNIAWFKDPAGNFLSIIEQNNAEGDRREMTQINCYLNFDGKAEEAMNFYRSVLGGEFMGEFMRWGTAPGCDEGEMKLTEEEKGRVMHSALITPGGSVLMASDSVSFAPPLIPGNSVTLSLNPPTKEEGDRLFAGLSEGGQVMMPMADAFWGGYFGSFADKYGINWLINVDTTGGSK